MYQQDFQWLDLYLQTANGLKLTHVHFPDGDVEGNHFKRLNTLEQSWAYASFVKIQATSNLILGFPFVNS